jgi:chaperone modulatory protein CbpM
MSMRTLEFQARTRIDMQVLDAWIEAGWLRPRGSRHHREFTEVDLARAHLIGELKGNLGVNDEAVPIVLDLIDQIHGLRRVVRHLVERERG